MIYLLVISISLAGIMSIVSARVLLRRRNVRRIVRSIKNSLRGIEDRGARLLPENFVEKPRKSVRFAAVELQQVRTLLREAEKALMKQDHKAAERILIQALTVQPDTTEIKAKLAHLYLETGREQKAEALYRELIQIHDDPSLFANLGVTCYRQEKYVEACQAYQEALNRDPKDPQRSYDLGRACFAAGRFGDSAPLLKKASQRMPRDTVLLRLLAQCYLQLDEAESAEEAYRQINRLEPRDEAVKEKIAELATR